MIEDHLNNISSSNSNIGKENKDFNSSSRDWKIPLGILTRALSSRLENHEVILTRAKALESF